MKTHIITINVKTACFKGSSAPVAIRARSLGVNLEIVRSGHTELRARRP